MRLNLFLVIGVILLAIYSGRIIDYCVDKLPKQYKGLKSYLLNIWTEWRTRNETVSIDIESSVPYQSHRTYGYDLSKTFPKTKKVFDKGVHRPRPTSTRDHSYVPPKLMIYYSKVNNVTFADLMDIANEDPSISKQLTRAECESIMVKMYNWYSTPSYEKWRYLIINQIKSR